MTLMTGCLAAAWEDVTEHFTDTATTAAATTLASTSFDPLPTTSEGADPVQTVTGPLEETTGAAGTTTGVAETTSSSGTTAPPEENEPPTVKLKVEPGHLAEAGQALLLLDPSPDVVTVRVSMNGVPLAELTPSDFPYVAFEALSAKDNTVEPHVFEVEVEDEGGLTASITAMLTVQLPVSGAEKCLFEDKAAIQSTIAAAVYTETAIVAAGFRDAGTGMRATLWKLDPNHCEVVLPGWPKTIDNWTGDEDLATPSSLATAVAVDEKGNIAVGGNLLVGGKIQRYTALLTADGGRLAEWVGAPGEAVSSVVFAPDGRVIAGGWWVTSDNPPRTDARFWRYQSETMVWKEDLKAPFTEDEQLDVDNERSEKIRAMLIEPETGLLVVAGEREFMDDLNNIYTRAFIARYVPFGPRVGDPSTSPGDAYLHDAVYSLAVCRDKLIAGGWTRDTEDPNITPPQPLFRWASNGLWTDRLPEAMLSTELRGAACDR
ncbi:MAG TPA: hypothetical protein VIK91_07315, partial [Nannocystis sp.]